MLWVIQRNLYGEEGYQRFVTALERLELPYKVVKPVPFFNKIIDPDVDTFAIDLKDVPEIEVDACQKIMVMGANTLTKVARDRGWQPGTFMNGNFSFEVWRDGFGSENLLNSDAAIITPQGAADGLPWLEEKVFARPVEDNKAFSGAVMLRDDLLSLLQSARGIKPGGLGELHAQTEILVSPVKVIHAEYRLFIIGGRVVTGSLYKQGIRVSHSEFLPLEVVKFAEQMVGRWMPAKAFVLDVAETDEGCKIVEINNLNSAGFYASDVFKIIMSLEDLFA